MQPRSKRRRCWIQTLLFGERWRQISPLPRILLRKVPILGQAPLKDHHLFKGWRAPPFLRLFHQRTAMCQPRPERLPPLELPDWLLSPSEKIPPWRDPSSFSYVPQEGRDQMPSPGCEPGEGAFLGWFQPYAGYRELEEIGWRDSLVLPLSPWLACKVRTTLQKECTGEACIQSGDWRIRPYQLHCRKRLSERQDQSDGVGSASFSPLKKNKKKKKTRKIHQLREYLKNIYIKKKEKKREKKERISLSTEPNLVFRLRLGTDDRGNTNSPWLGGNHLSFPCLYQGGCSPMYYLHPSASRRKPRVGWCGGSRWQLYRTQLGLNLTGD